MLIIFSYLNNKFLILHKMLIFYFYSTLMSILYYKLKYDSSLCELPWGFGMFPGKKYKLKYLLKLVFIKT